MMKNGWRRAIPIGAAMSGLLGLVIGVGTSPSSAAPQSPKPQFTTVATGFDNPRGLAFGEDGQLYVGEAGKGGPKCIAGGPEGDLCPGLTSGISVIRQNGSHHRILDGLLSVSSEGGIGATGIDGISINEDGGLYGIITSCRQQVEQLPADQFDPALLATLKDEAGQEIKVTGPNRFRTVAPVGNVDWQWTLDHQDLVPGQFPDCNPYGILALEHSQWVVDAASNTIDHVVHGNVDVEQFVPNPDPKHGGTSDAVPTCIAQGPDGALYVSQLTGGGNPPGLANVYRFDPRTEHLDVWASGLTAVTGCGFGPGGHFYATEFSTTGGGGEGGPFTGALVRVDKGDTTPTVVASGLSFPNGFATRGNSIYVSNWSISPANPPQGGPPFPPGEVVKIHVSNGHGDQD